MATDPTKKNTRSSWKNFPAFKPLRVKVRQCGCGNRYVKTREGQERCLTCLFRPVAA